MIDPHAIYPDLCNAGIRSEPHGSGPDIDDGQVEICRQYLKNVPKAKQLNRSDTSYGLKSLVETKGGYVTQGAFIKAAILEGFMTRPIKQTSSVYLNITKAEVRRLMFEGW